MSLYNMACGIDPNALHYLATIGLEECAIPRFRDCYWDGTHIVVYTRTGGGNREDYIEENAALTRHPGYVRDADDARDSTYASFYFAVPEAHRAAYADRPADVSPSDRLWAVIAALRGNGG